MSQRSAQPYNVDVGTASTPKSQSILVRTGRYTAELWRRREFALYLGWGSFSSKNAGTSLGLIWWVLNPLLLGGVYFLVFGFLFDSRTPEFLVYLIAGMFVFQFSAQSFSGGAQSILSNAKLLVNVRFPRLVLPIARIVESGIGFLFSLAVLGFIGLLIGVPVFVGPVWLLLLAVPLQVMFNIGLAALSARLAVPFRDITNFLPYLNRIWLYTSPIIWTVDRFDGADATILTLLKLNPMWHILAIYRAALLGSTYEWANLGYFAASTALVFFVGVGLFVKYERLMVQEL